MCNLSKGIEDRGIEKGILSSIKNLMESMNWSPEQAMDALKLSADERGKYISALRQKSEKKSGLLLGGRNFFSILIQRTP
ncbi:MAG: hypothetical protein SOZ48_07700 [Eubacterium sp.]|nr:hypothetical protein [Eubacterium sp.]